VAAGSMARTYLIFGEIEGKLDVLCVECTKCARKVRYHVLRQYVEMVVRPERRLPEARCTQPAQTLRLAVP
jgi:hypothetical protein